ncbi:hypothetical protein B296_00028521 [Ensete ventricosum]|uniref:Rx N-terminal domain-containing protein n=1 Tax=Ensete ventricosum TaxID=4639 RepID=A0A426ZS18_ENSVE|nr:hypothetical protein B296_00028521 [Ensete ventricosum]
MKSGVGPEAVVAVEKWANDLKVEVNRLKVKYLDLCVEEDPFVDRSEDTNVQMESNQPFDDIVPPKG